MTSAPAERNGRVRFPGVRAPKPLLSPAAERQLRTRQLELLDELEEKFLRLTAALPLLVPEAERDGRLGERQDQPTNPSVSTGPKRSGTQLERSHR